MRIGSSLGFLLALQLGCTPAPSAADGAPAPAVAPGPSGGPQGDGGPPPDGAPPGGDGPVADASAAPAGPAGPPAPAFGPNAGAVFHEDTMVAMPIGGLEQIAGWGAVDAAGARALGCLQQSVPLKVGTVLVSCTKQPEGGSKTGWTKIEITGKTGGSYAFRYEHWPAVGGAALEGTGKWTPDGEKSALTYTHGKAVTGTPKKPEPTGPALTDPEPTGPAATGAGPTGGGPDPTVDAKGYEPPAEGEPPPEDKPSPPPSDGPAPE